MIDTQKLLHVAELEILRSVTVEQNLVKQIPEIAHYILNGCQGVRLEFSTKALCTFLNVEHISRFGLDLLCELIQTLPWYKKQFATEPGLVGDEGKVLPIVVVAFATSIVV